MPLDNDIVSKYVAQALAAAAKKQEKKQEKKIFLKNKPPERRLTIGDVKGLYTKAAISPSRNIYWFYEDHPLLQQSYLDEDARDKGSPFGVLVLLQANQLNPIPDWVAGSTHKWNTGQIAQLTGFSTSYICGFNVGFDGHAPGHRLCSYHFHCGYADGKIISSLLLKEALLLEVESDDPFKEIDDENDINELIRIQGYWRDEWGPKPKFLLDTTDLTEERLQELGLSLLASRPSDC